MWKDLDSGNLPARPERVVTVSAQPFGDEHALKCELASEVLRSSGQLRLQVTGWSMLPSIWPGDTLLLERATTDEVSEGDIVLFCRDRRLFAHRVIRKNEAPRIITRGDAMPRADAAITDEELLGRVAEIVRDGLCFEPSRELRFSERAVAAVVRSSNLAARVVVGIHGMMSCCVIAMVRVFTGGWGLAGTRKSVVN